MKRGIRKGTQRAIIGGALGIALFLGGCTSDLGDKNHQYMELEEKQQKEEEVVEEDAGNFVVEEAETEQQVEELPEKNPEDYVRMHDDNEYADLLVTMETCFWDETFENPESIDDLSLYLLWCLSNEYSTEEYEKWYNSETNYYEIPGENVRKTACKYFTFNELNLADYISIDSDSGQKSEWYDVSKDIYHQRYIGGFGGPHDGYEKIEIEILEYGVVKAVGTWKMEDRSPVTAEIVVEESADGNMRLMSYAHTVGEAVAYTLEELETMAREYRKRHGLYENSYVTAYEGDGNQVIIQCYDVIIDDPETGEGHTATSAWYTVDMYTAVGTDDMGEYIDLKN